MALTSSERFTRYVDALTATEVLELHRVVSRRAQVIYARTYRRNYETGVANARAKRAVPA